MGYQVITPLIIAKDEGGADVYAYLGQPVPSNVAEDEIKRLVKGGFIEKVTAAEEPAAPAAPAPASPAPAAPAAPATK